MQKFITDYSQLSNSGKIIILIWIPSHVGIGGNGLADEAAKSALNLPMSAVKCPATDLYSDVVNHSQRLWQAEWDGCVLKQIILCQTYCVMEGYVLVLLHEHRVSGYPKGIWVQKYSKVRALHGTARWSSCAQCLP